MGLELEWLLKQEDNLSLAEGLKEEKLYQHKFKWLSLKV